MAEPQAPARPSNPPFAKGSIIWQKRGPLPIWAWTLIVLLVLLVVVWWRRNRAAAGVEPADPVESYEQLPGDQTAPPVFVVPSAPNPIITTPINVTVPPAPPGGGRPMPPPRPPGMPAPKPVPEMPAPKPVPQAPKPAPPGGYVSVTQFPDRTYPRESTMWDIAYSWLPQGASNWKLIWNHPLNVDVVRKRGGDYHNIRRGDSFFVPNKLRTARR